MGRSRVRKERISRYSHHGAVKFWINAAGYEVYHHESGRVTHRMKTPFEACVLVKGSHIRSCAKGKNPRTALAKALREHARYIGERRGAFAGTR